VFLGEKKTAKKEQRNKTVKQLESKYVLAAINPTVSIITLNVTD
jgi:hypothetical protein